MSLYNDPPTGDPTDPPKKSKRTIKSEELINSFGADRLGQVLNRRYDLHPFDSKSYNFGTEVVEDGNRVMIVGNPDKGRGHVVLDKRKDYLISPQQLKKLREDYRTAEGRKQVKTFLEEKGFLKSSYGMTDKQLQDFLYYIEMNAEDLNNRSFYEKAYKDYGMKPD